MRAFRNLSFLPSCVGAIDGTSIRMEKPKEYGDTYHCYKKFVSIILLACVDANGLFTYTHAGTPGSCGGAHIWNDCDLHKDLPDMLKVPQGHEHEWRLAGTNQIVTPLIVADGAFALSDHV